MRYLKKTCKFNIDHPEDFRGHSPSVSNVIEVYESEGTEKGFCFCAV